MIRFTFKKVHSGCFSLENRLEGPGVVAKRQSGGEN